MEIKHQLTEITRAYEITGAEHMRNASGSWFEPERTTVTLVAVGGEMRPVHIEIRGPRIAGKQAGRYTDVGYAVSLDRVEPHYRNGEAPEWVRELVRQAAGGAS